MLVTMIIKKQEAMNLRGNGGTWEGSKKEGGVIYFN